MKKLTLAAVLGATLLAGCSSTQHLRQSDEISEARAAEAASYLQQMREGEVTTHVRVVEEGHYMPIREVVTPHLDSHPISCEIEYNPVMPASLQEIGQAISESCHLVVRVTPDAAAAVERMAYGSRRGNEQDTVPDVGSDGPILSPLMAMQSLPMVGTSRDRSDLVSIAWSGQVSGMLDAVTSRLGLSWRYRDGIISIFHLDTRIYRVQAIPSTSRMESTVHSGARSSAGVSTLGSGSSDNSGGISGSSGSNQLTSVEVATDFMADLQETVSQMLTPQTGRMALSRASGTLSVTDTPETLDRITLYVDQLNEFTTKQVLLNVKVLNVTLSSNDEMGINWNAIYTNLADQYGLRLSNALNASSEAISGSVSILEGGNSRFAGSDLIVNALAQVGKVSVVTQPSVTTLNLEPVPVQVARQVSYLERVELGQTAQVGSTTSLTPGSVTTGFNMMLLPHILDDSRTVLLQYSMNLSTLDNLRTASSGGSTIEIPEIDSRIFNQKVRLKSNETLIISGFEQLANDTRRSGVGSARFWPFGGGARGNQRRDVIVVLITPVVIA